MLGLIGIFFSMHGLKLPAGIAPALLAGSPYLAQLWLFILAPIAGALIAGLFARVLYEDSSIVETVVVEQRRSA